MWPTVDVDDMLTSKYKKSPGRPKKLRFREHDETRSKTRSPGVAYRCTKCDHFDHNSRKCKNNVQNPNALKINATYHCLLCTIYYLTTSCIN